MNGFGIFSWAVAAVPKVGLMVIFYLASDFLSYYRRRTSCFNLYMGCTVAVWDVVASMWTVTASMWAVSVSVWAVTSSMGDVTG